MSQLLDQQYPVLIHLISMLDMHSKVQLANTCTFFRDFVHNPIWWTDLKWKFYEDGNNIINIKLILRLKNINIRALNMTGRNREHILSQIIPEIRACRNLQSLTFTSVDLEEADYVSLFGIPTLSELHIYCVLSYDIKYPKMNPTDSNLRIMSVSSTNYKFENWVESGYFPPDLRVIMPRLLSWTECFDLDKHVEQDSILTKYEPSTSIEHTACLTFKQPLLKYVSLPPVPVAQYHFSPPDMYPSIQSHCSPGVIQDLVLIKDGCDSNTYSSAASCFYSHIFQKIYLRQNKYHITSLHIVYESLKGDHLKDIATTCPKLLHLDIRYNDYCLCDLSGLESIALSCSDLQSLNIDTTYYVVPINLQGLW